jgi:imidazolonepropionase-like amidohydrolase
MMFADLTLSLLLAATAVEHVRVEVGDGQVLDDVTVLFDEREILAVGAQVKVPEGTRKIDGKGKVLCPGFIDPFSQLGLTEVELEGQTRDLAIEKQPLVPGFQAASGFNPMTVWLPVERESGVTSAVLVPSGGVLAGQMHWVSLTGSLRTLPNLDVPVGLLGSVAHDAAGAVGGSRGALWLTLNEVFDDARLYASNKKAFQENRLRKLSLSGLHFDALQPVLQKKIPLVLEANRASDILAALRFAKAQNIRLVLVGAAEGHLVAAELAAAKVPVMVTPSSQIPQSFDALHARDDLAGRLEKAGVDVVIAAQDNSHRRLRQEAGIAVAYGMTRPQALAAITGNTARALGLGLLGKIATKHRADLVLWTADPLEISSQPERIFIAGVEQSKETRQSQLVRRYLGKR